MAYATAADLRLRYTIDSDEFELRDDESLDRALLAASDEIDSWRPPGTLGIAALDVIKDKTLTLGRMLVYQNEALDGSHPIVRDGMAVRAWLRALAAGTVQLPIDATADGITGTVVTHTRSFIYDSAFDSRYLLS